MVAKVRVEIAESEGDFITAHASHRHRQPQQLVLRVQETGGIRRSSIGDEGLEQDPGIREVPAADDDGDRRLGKPGQFRSGVRGGRADLAVDSERP